VVKVHPVVPTAIPVTVAVRIDPLFRFPDVQPAVLASITLYITGLGIGDDLVWTELTGAIATTPGVIDHQLATPTANIPAGIGGHLIAGPITVTQWIV
jgi:uncharacterized phage protein gp47/JayE